jgi:hypothetical protein
LHKITLDYTLHYESKETGSLTENSIPHEWGCEGSCFVVFEASSVLQRCPIPGPVTLRRRNHAERSTGRESRDGAARGLAGLLKRPGQTTSVDFNPLEFQVYFQKHVFCRER